MRDVYFDSGLQGWIKNTARLEHWRMAGWYDLADLIQDGYVCYCKCRDRYTLGPPDPGHQALHAESGTTGYPNDAQRRHFMSLVQRAFYNHIMTLSSNFARATESPLCDVATDGDEMTTLENLVPAQPEEASIIVALKTAPAEISGAIQRLIEDGAEGGQYLRSRLRMRGNRITRGRRALRETTSERLTRVLGDPDLHGKTMAYFLS